MSPREQLLVLDFAKNSLVIWHSSSCFRSGFNSRNTRGRPYGSLLRSATFQASGIIARTRSSWTQYRRATGQAARTWNDRCSQNDAVAARTPLRILISCVASVCGQMPLAVGLLERYFGRGRQCSSGVAPTCKSRWLRVWRRLARDWQVLSCQLVAAGSFRWCGWSQRRGPMRIVHCLQVRFCRWPRPLHDETESEWRNGIQLSSKISRSDHMCVRPALECSFFNITLIWSDQYAVSFWTHCTDLCVILQLVVLLHWNIHRGLFHETIKKNNRWNKQVEKPLFNRVVCHTDRLLIVTQERAWRTARDVDLSYDVSSYNALIKC